MIINIAKLSPESWEKYKTLRLEALLEETASFGGSYDDEILLSDDIWKKRLSDSERTEAITLFFAIDENNLIGMIGVNWKDNEKSRHIANIFGVYVKSQYRRKGIGKKLMEKMLGFIETYEYFEKVKLNVVTSQIPALKMYQGFGFEIAGTCKKDLKIGDTYYDEHIMEKMLS